MTSVSGSVRGLAALFVLAPFVLGMSVLGAGPAMSRPLALSIEPIALDDEDLERTRIGRLVWRGGFVLTSPYANFGGLSGLAVSPDGKTLSMVSDAGRWFRMRAGYDRDGNLQTLDTASMGRLRGPLGAVASNKNGGDAESLESVPGGLAVSFEHNHRLWIYRGAPNPFNARPEEILYPPILARAHPNQGVETLARLGDGRLVAIAEGFPLGNGDLLGWVRQDDRPATPWQEFRYRRNLLFRPTGATVLADGDMLLVERRFTWVGGFAARLAIVPSAAIRPGVVLEAKSIAEFDRAPLAENFEGVAARRDAKGRTLIYMVSDDNFTVLQRTLLVMFELVD
jgi:hypothetical protein